MTRFKLSTLSFALLGALALTACDRDADTAAVDTSTPDTTAAATPPVEPMDDTAPVADINNPAATTESTDPATMGDVNEYPMEGDEPSLAPEPEPVDPTMDDSQDLEEPVDETPAQ